MLSFRRISMTLALAFMSFCLLISNVFAESKSCSLSEHVPGVRYFGETMKRIPTDRAGTSAWTHGDDPRMTVTFKMVVTPPFGGISRLDYVNQAGKSLWNVMEEKVKGATRTKVRIHAFDPIRIVVDGLSKDQQTALTSNVIILNSSCSLQADISAPNSQALMSRRLGMQNAVEAVFALAARSFEPLPFSEAHAAPKGGREMLMVLVFPFVAAAALGFLVTRSLPPTDAGPSVTRVVSLMMLVCLGAVFANKFPALVTIDIPATAVYALAALVLFGAVGILLRWRAIQILTMTFAVCLSVVLSSYGIFGWSSTPAIIGGTAFAIGVMAILSLSIWGRSNVFSR